MFIKLYIKFQLVQEIEARYKLNFVLTIYTSNPLPLMKTYSKIVAVIEIYSFQSSTFNPLYPALQRKKGWFLVILLLHQWFTLYTFLQCLAPLMASPLFSSNASFISCVNHAPTICLLPHTLRPTTTSANLPNGLSFQQLMHWRLVICSCSCSFQ